MRKASLALILVVMVLFALSRVRAEQAPWNGIYDSIKQLSVEYRQGSSAETDSSPVRHSSKKKHHSSPSPKKSDEEAKSSPTLKPFSEESDKKTTPDSQGSNDQSKKEAAEKKSDPSSVASFHPTTLPHSTTHP